MKLDFENSDQITDFTTVPAGAYLCRIAEVRDRQSRAGDTMWSIRLVVTEGEFTGRMAAWDNLVFSNRGLNRVKSILVALGLPLLAGGRGGMVVFAGPTLGYLIGFPLGAFVIGLVADRFAKPKTFLPALTGAVVGGIGVVTVCGIIGMAVMMKVSLLTATGYAMPFIPGDILKAVIAAAITAALYKARPGFANA